MSGSSASEVETITLTSKDGTAFHINRKAATELSETIKYALEGTGKSILPVDVDAKTLRKILEWMEYRYVHPLYPKGGPEEKLEDKYRTDNLTEWDEAFLREIDSDMDLQFDLLAKANYLDVRGLLSLMCKYTARMMKGLSPEQIAEKFKLPESEISTA